MDKDSVAHGPANEVVEWATYRATVNFQNRTQVTTFHLINRELGFALKEIAAKDSAIAVKDTIIEWQTGRIEFYAEQLRKCQERKPMRLVWFGAGVVAGWFTKQELED
jgi:hypothetical protein